MRSKIKVACLIELCKKMKAIFDLLRPIFPPPNDYENAIIILVNIVFYRDFVCFSSKKYFCFWFCPVSIKVQFNVLICMHEPNLVDVTQ